MKTTKFNFVVNVNENEAAKFSSVWENAINQVFKDTKIVLMPVSDPAGRLSGAQSISVSGSCDPYKYPDEKWRKAVKEVCSLVIEQFSLYFNQTAHLSFSRIDYINQEPTSCCG